MGRRARRRQEATSDGVVPAPPSDDPASAPPASPAVALVLAATLFIAPAAGVPHPFLLQDTFKSMVVALATLVAALWLFWRLRAPAAGLRWHPVLGLPLLLAAYALASMAWSHAWLAAVEAIRWAVFALLLWIGLNAVSRERLGWIAVAIHAGAVLAAFWAALQFWFDLRLFPQGAPPASTFVNRNFLAEYAACALPFSMFLLLASRRSAAVSVMAASTGLVVLAVMMTGTRSALAAVGLQLFVLGPAFAWRLRRHLAAFRWPAGLHVLATGVLAVVVGGLGSVPSGNPRLLKEGRGTTALERAVQRATTVSPADASINLRLQMWTSTARMVADHPLAGVGAGAWEVHIPRYQAPDAEVEIDYYAHQEPLQLLAEYGAAGLAFLLGVAAFFVRFARQAWQHTESAESPWRAGALCSLASMLLVSQAGFPWRMAATGALFALSLAVLAAGDGPAIRRVTWPPTWRLPALGVTAAALALAAYISQQAAACERRLVEASQLAQRIASSPDPSARHWDNDKERVLQLTREAIAIHPHYRKITPEIADAMANWGDWRNATWVWESVLASRPYVPAMLTNAGRGHAWMGHREEALRYLERARRIAPQARSVKLLEAEVQRP